MKEAFLHSEAFSPTFELLMDVTFQIKIFRIATWSRLEVGSFLRNALSHDVPWSLSWSSGIWRRVVGWFSTDSTALQSRTLHNNSCEILNPTYCLNLSLEGKDSMVSIFRRCESEIPCPFLYTRRLMRDLRFSSRPLMLVTARKLQFFDIFTH
jgi:hypothetical protein